MKEEIVYLPGHPHGGGIDQNYRLTLQVPRKRFPQYLKYRWWVPLILAMLAVVVVVAYELVRTETYESYAQLYLSGNIRVADTAIFSEESLNYLGTQIELLKSPRLRSAAYRRIQNARNNTNGFPVKIDVVQPMKSSVLFVSAKGSDPVVTQAYLDTLVNEYLDYKKETRTSTSQDVLISMTEQLTKQEKDLRVEQDKLLNFQKENNLLVLNQESVSAGNYLALLKQKLAELKLEYALSTTSTNTSEAGEAPPTMPLKSDSLSARSGPKSSTPAAPDLAYLSLQQELGLLRLRKAEWGKIYREKHPKMIAVSEDIQRREALLEITRDQTQTRQSELNDGLRLKIEKVDEGIQSWEKKVLDTNTRLAESERYKLNLERQQKFYDHLLGLLQSVDLNKNLDRENLSVLSPASESVPTDRFLPVRIILAIVAGAALGLGLVFLWDRADDRFFLARELREQFGEALAGQVPRVRLRKSRGETAVLREDDPRPAYLEAFRSMRSSLLFGPESTTLPRTILITSAEPRAGKSTIAANLARALAWGGSSVLLVDADLRRGDLHDLLQLRAEPGLANHLSGTAAPEEIVQKTALPNLSFIARGTSTDRSGELVLGSSMTTLLRNSSVVFDFTIFDTPPIFAADDAVCLAPKADAVFLVVRRRFTRGRAARQALDMLYQRGVKAAQFVFNQADLSSREYPYTQYKPEEKSSGPSTRWRPWKKAQRKDEQAAGRNVQAP